MHQTLLKKIHKKILKKDPGLILTQRNLLVAQYMYESKDKREIPAIVNEQVVVE